MLGLYDSGLGGLTVLAALRIAGVQQDIVYFADQAHVPYGDRDDVDLYALLTENFALLDSYGVDAVVMACNTSCAVARRRGGFPPARYPVLDLIESAALAFHETRFARIGVFATAATVRSAAYKHAIARVAPQLEIVEIAAPALVPLVESGETTSRRARAEVAAVCRELPAATDAIVYGCTHYPLLDAAFAAALGPHVARLDPAHAQARAVATLLQTRPQPAGTGITHYLTNGDLAEFTAAVNRAMTTQSNATFARVSAHTAQQKSIGFREQAR